MGNQKKTGGFAIASFILGIVAILLSCVLIGIVPAFFGIVFAVLTLKDQSKKQGLAIAGMICSIVGVLEFILILAIADYHVYQIYTILGFVLLCCAFPASIMWLVMNILSKRKIIIPICCMISAIIVSSIIIIFSIRAYSNTDEYKEYLVRREIERQEREEQQKIEQEKLEQERLEQERLEQQRREEEQAEQARLEQERLEQEKLKQTDILFMEIPWGTNYTTVDRDHGELNIWAISGENFKTYSIDDIVLGDYQGIDFEYTDINIIANALTGEIDVAGYTTSKVVLYFAYIPVGGKLTKTEKDSALYGAQYVFEPKNLKVMSADLIEKLSLVYGKPDKETKDTDIWGNKYTYTWWYGPNNANIVLKQTDSSKDSTGFYSDEIIISYVWLKGDELLQNASDILKKEAIEKESESYGNNSTNGL